MHWMAKGVLLVHVLRHASIMKTDANLLHEDLAGILACTSQVSLVLSQA